MKRSQTILHVEDDPNDVFLLKRALREAHLNVTFQHVPDGAQALNYLSGTGPFANRNQYPRPDLILLDLKLPLMSGFEVLAWARSQRELRRLPIFVLSSSDLREDVNRARQLGSDRYFVKSVRFAEVVEAVKETLVRGDSQPAVPLAATSI